MKENFRAELAKLINRESMENGSDTPDFILAEYLQDCLDVYDRTVRAREKWYGREPKPVPSYEAPKLPPPLDEQLREAAEPAPGKQADPYPVLPDGSIDYSRPRAKSEHDLVACDSCGGKVYRHQLTHLADVNRHICPVCRDKLKKTKRCGSC